MHRLNNKQERQEGQDTRHSALKCITVTSASSSEDEEEDEDETDAVAEMTGRDDEKRRDDEEMEEGELRGGTPETSRQVMEDDLGGLVVRRDLRQEAEEEEEERDSEEEAEIRDEDRGGDEDEDFLFDESQLEFDEFNDSTRLSSELYVVVCFVIFIHTSTM